MDHQNTLLAAALAASLLAVGCSKSASPDAASASADAPAAAADSRDPAAVMAEFLEALRQGDDKKATSLLTTVARTKAEEMEMFVAPPESETASYKVLEQEVEGNQAQVGADWTDLDLDGKPATYRTVWMLKKEKAGWRISGMATRLFEDLPPTVLNFEDPAEMLRKQQEAEEEMARRQSVAQPERQAQETSPGEEATVR
ncbi:MAG: hypothetical protein DWQ37_12505 [Planctomycetota bacterium]|nr:MAG: hypothetical protein DWQ37_12505 [Planctomycetota bacterium]